MNKFAEFVLLWLVLGTIAIVIDVKLPDLVMLRDIICLITVLISAIIYMPKE